MSTSLSVDAPAGRAWDAAIETAASTSSGFDALVDDVEEMHRTTERAEFYCFMDREQIPVRPPVVRQADLARLGECASRVFSVLSRVAAGDPSLRLDVLGDAELPDSIEPLLSDGSTSHATTLDMYRPDVIVRRGQPKFIEFNVNTALGGLHEAALVPELYLGTHLGKSLTEHFKLGAPNPIVALAAFLREAWVAYGRGTSTPRVAVVGDDFHPGLDAWMATRLSCMGIPATAVRPERLDFRDGAVHLDGTAVDVVYRAYPLSAVRDPSDAARMDAVISAAGLSGTLVLPNDQATVTRSSKLAIAALWERVNDLDPESCDAVRRHVPWTARIDGPYPRVPPDEVGKNWAGFSGDQRHRFVLKPIRGQRGEGVVIGRDTSIEEWESAVAEAAAHGGHVVQEFVEGDRMVLPFIHSESRRIRRHELSPIFGPYMIGGQIQGLNARFQRASSAGPLSVLGAGAGATTCLVEWE